MADTAVFPTDPVTLAMLRAAATPDDEGRTHLTEFLWFPSDPITDQELGARVGETIHIPGEEPWGIAQVVRDLVDEIERLRNPC